MSPVLASVVLACAYFACCVAVGFFLANTSDDNQVIF
jgi:hypothetical protein